MMICQHCGAEITNGSNFCTYCGTPVAHNHPAGTPIPPYHFAPPLPAPRAYKLNLEKLFGDTFELYKRHFGTMCLVGLCLVGIPFVLGLCGAGVEITMRAVEKMGNSDFLVILLMCCYAFLQIFSTLVQWYLILGAIRQSLYLVRGGVGFQANIMFPPLMVFLKFAGLMFVLFCLYVAVMFPAAIPIVIGLVLSVFAQNIGPLHVTMLWVVAGCMAIPCGLVMIWLSVRLYLAMCFLADGNAGIVDSITYSWRVSSRNFWMLFIAMLTLLILSMLGYFLCCVGIILTGAIYIFGSALVYLQLTGQPNCLGYPPPH
jgi:membrane-anchored glycerophosphoryl diester phosphodiesterase (GDPDase)